MPGPRIDYMQLTLTNGTRVTLDARPKRPKPQVGDKKVDKQGRTWVRREVWTKEYGKWYTVSNGRGGTRLEWVLEGTPLPWERP